MVNELQRIMSAFIQILFIILLPYIWWFLTARGKVPFMEWIGLKAIKRVEDSYLIAWIIGGFLLFTIFSMFIFPLTRSIETATSAFSDMGLKALPSILIYSFLQTSLPEELLFRGFLLKRLVNHMPFFLCKYDTGYRFWFASWNIICLTRIYRNYSFYYLVYRSNRCLFRLCQ